MLRLLPCTHRASADGLRCLAAVLKHSARHGAGPLRSRCFLSLVCRRGLPFYFSIGYKSDCPVPHKHEMEDIDVCASHGWRGPNDHERAHPLIFFSPLPLDACECNFGAPESGIQRAHTQMLASPPQLKMCVSVGRSDNAGVPRKWWRRLTATARPGACFTSSLSAWRGGAS